MFEFIRYKPWLFVMITSVLLFIISVTLLVNGAIPGNMGWLHFLYFGLFFFSAHMMNRPKKTIEEKREAQKKKEVQVTRRAIDRIVKGL